MDERGRPIEFVAAAGFGWPGAEDTGTKAAVCKGAERSRQGAVAAWLAEKGLAVADFVARSSWLYEAYPYINAYLDEPRSLDELHELVSSTGKGYDVNHIVEQTPADQDGFPRRFINRDDNLVRIPTLKHWQLNAWYQTRNPDFGNVSPRDYLRGKNWDERRRVGLDALIRFGVLRP